MMNGTAKTPGKTERGVLLIGVMLLVVLVGIGALVASPYFGSIMRREQEDELRHRLSVVRQGLDLLGSSTEIRQFLSLHTDATDAEKQALLKKHMINLVKSGRLREFAQKPNLEGLTFNITENVLAGQDPSFEKPELETDGWKVGVKAMKLAAFLPMYISPIKKYKCPWCTRALQGDYYAFDTVSGLYSPGWVFGLELNGLLQPKHNGQVVLKIECQYKNSGCPGNPKVPDTIPVSEEKWKVDYPFFRMVNNFIPCAKCVANNNSNGGVQFLVSSENGLLYDPAVVDIDTKFGISSLKCRVCTEPVDYMVETQGSIRDNITKFTNKEADASAVAPSTPNNTRYANWEGQSDRFGRRSICIWNPPGN